MVRLTADVLARAESRLNPAGRDRELLLRGLRVTVVENMAILQDGYDVVDLSDNEIKRLDNWPLGTKRLGCLLLNNNLVSRVAPTLGQQVPNLTALILTGNRISSLSEILHLATLTKLEHLSLLENPVAHNANYRLFCVHHVPSLKSLDFRKVGAKEREEAKKLFASEAGKALLDAVSQEAKALASGAGAGAAGGGAGGKQQLALTDEQKAQVRAAIEGAKTREEIDLVERQLRTGTFVFAAAGAGAGAGAPPAPPAPVAPPAPPAHVSAAVGAGDDDDDVDMS